MKTIIKWILYFISAFCILCSILIIHSSVSGGIFVLFVGLSIFFIARKCNSKAIKCKVVGVSFNNDDGSSRQTYLRKIHFKDAPFNDRLEIALKQYEYNSEIAFGVFANNKQIGNIPKDKIKFIKERELAITDFNVYGGGTNEDGERLNYGANVTIKVGGIASKVPN